MTGERATLAGVDRGDPLPKQVQGRFGVVHDRRGGLAHHVDEAGRHHQPPRRSCAAPGRSSSGRSGQSSLPAGPRRPHIRARRRRPRSGRRGSPRPAAEPRPRRGRKRTKSPRLLPRAGRWPAASQPDRLEFARRRSREENSYVMRRLLANSRPWLPAASLPAAASSTTASAAGGTAPSTCNP